MITIAFRLTSSDVFRTLILQTLRKSWFLLPLPIFGLVSIVGALLDPNNGAFSLNSGSVILAIGLLAFVISPYLQTRTIAKSPNFGGMMTLRISEAGIELSGEHSNARIGWPMIKRFSESNHAILINLKPVGFQIIPKRQISDSDLTALRSLLRDQASDSAQKV